jgi:hypothetical protein
VDKYERFLRQIDIINPEKCQELIYIIGAGATGSFTALSLAKMGFENIRIFDADTIEEHNFPNQMFPINALGENKALAVKDMVEYFTGVKIMANTYFYERQPLRGIVVAAVDTMEARKIIYKNCIKFTDVKLLIDPRTSPDVFRVLTVDMSLEGERLRYEKTLHSDAQAQDIPCTARAVIYSILLVAAFVAKQIRQFQMNQKYERDLVLDIINNAIITF